MKNRRAKVLSTTLKTGITVFDGNTVHDFLNATGWGVENGILAIAETGPDGIPNTIAVFRSWDRAGWTAKIKV